MFLIPKHCDEFLVKGISTFMEVFSLMDERNSYFRQNNPLYDSSCGKELWQDVKMVIVMILAIPVSTDYRNPPFIPKLESDPPQKHNFCINLRVVSRRLG